MRALRIDPAIPLSGFVTYDSAPIAGLIVPAAGMCLWRGPVVTLTRWPRRRMEE
jgi:hypothetical protein